MAKIIDTRSSIDQTIRIFDEFYGFDLLVNGNEFDIVNSYFKSVCENEKIAGNFTVYLFRISQETNVPVLDLLNNIQGLDKMKMNAFITYYLNSFKSKTTLYGISTILQPNQAIARNIVQ